MLQRSVELAARTGHSPKCFLARGDLVGAFNDHQLVYSWTKMSISQMALQSRRMATLCSVETFHYRITRYWLKGPKKGTRDVFADNLPGFADGLMYDGNGLLWVAVDVPRSRLLDWAHERPELKNELSKLDGAALLSLVLSNHTFVIALDGEGKIVRSLHETSGKLKGISNVVPHSDGYAYFGALLDHKVTRYKLKLPPFARDRPHDRLGPWPWSAPL